MTTKHRRTLARLFAAACLVGTLPLLAPTLVTPAKAEVQILRDKNGVPHIYGNSNFEVFYGFGYAYAQDRLFQMEMRKRQAQGRLAEVLGKGDKRWADKYLAKDQEARLAFDAKEMAVEFSALSLANKEIIEGFTQGINQVITEVLQEPKARLAKPFHDYGFQPELWSAIDTLGMAVDVLGAYSSFSTQLLGLELYEFLRAAHPKSCDDIFDQLLWLKDVNAPTTLRDHQRGGPDPAQAGPKGCAAEDKAPNGLVLTPTIDKLAGSPELIAASLTPKRASMSWLVGRDRAAGQRSILLNGPQPGWHSPSYYYPVGLHGGDFDLVGFAAEGSFIIELGVNSALSWGITAGLGYQTDHFQLMLEKPGAMRYRFGNEWRPLTSRRETIKVRDEPDVTFEILSSVHGPVVAGGPDDKFIYARKTAWASDGAASVMAWVHAGHAKTYDEWLAYAQDFAFGYNWFYADREGQVGFAFTGRYPDLNPGRDLRLPAAGTGAHEWRGLLAKTANPSLLTTDFIVNFNNKPAKDWPNSGLYWEQWAEANQVDILLDAFAKKPKLTSDDMWALNRAVAYTDVSAGYFIPFILDALKDAPDGSDAAMARNLVADWNRMRTDDDQDGLYDHAGQTIFDAWLPIMVERTLGPTLKGFKYAGIWTQAGYQRQAPRLEEHPSAGTLATYHALLDAEGRSGVRHYHDFFAGAAPAEVIRQSMQQAIASLKKTYTGPMNGWKAKVVPQVFFDSNAARAPITSPGKQFVLPLYANRGATTLQSAYGLDGKSVTARYINPPGQSGFIAPNGKVGPRFYDQLEAYRDFRSYPLYRDKEKIILEMSAKPIFLSVQNPYQSRL